MILESQSSFTTLIEKVSPIEPHVSSSYSVVLSNSELDFIFELRQTLPESIIAAIKVYLFVLQAFDANLKFSRPKNAQRRRCFLANEQAAGSVLPFDANCSFENRLPPRESDTKNVFRVTKSDGESSFVLFREVDFVDSFEQEK
jgi:hypothetical protein